MLNIGNILVRVMQGDLSKLPADAYVVPQFIDCASFGGVGGSLFRAGAGPGLHAYDAYASNHKLPFGNTHLTPSGGGLAQYLIHATSVGSGANVEFETVQNCCFGAAVLAHSHGLKRLVFPAMGTGIIGQLTDQQSALAMFSGIYQANQKIPELACEITVCIYANPHAFAVFERVLKERSYVNTQPSKGMREFDPYRWMDQMQRDMMANFNFENQ